MKPGTKSERFGGGGFPNRLGLGRGGSLNRLGD